MPFGGEAFEEFVAVYFRHVSRPGYLIQAHVNYLRDREMQRKLGKKSIKQAYWSDIDVLGLKGKEAFVASCDENCGKKYEKIIDELNFATEYVKQRHEVETVEKFYAFSVGWSPKVNKDKLEKLKNDGIQVLTFVGMLGDFIGKLRNETENYRKSAGKFTEPIMWALREIDMIQLKIGEPIFPESPTLEGKPKIKSNIIIRWP